MRANSVAAACAAALVLALPVAAQDLGSGRWIDLTHPFNADSVYWPTAETFELEEVFHGHTEGGWFYTAYNFSAAEHGGTHLDAPIHFAEGALTADAIPVEQMIGPAFVIDVSAAAPRTSTTRSAPPTSRPSRPSTGDPRGRRSCSSTPARPGWPQPRALHGHRRARRGGGRQAALPRARQGRRRAAGRPPDRRGRHRHAVASTTASRRTSRRTWR